jgi:hypothetical protein
MVSGTAGAGKLPPGSAACSGQYDAWSLTDVQTTLVMSDGAIGTTDFNWVDDPANGGNADGYICLEASTSSRAWRGYLFKDDRYVK